MEFSRIIIDTEKIVSLSVHCSIDVFGIGKFSYSIKLGFNDYDDHVSFVEIYYYDVEELKTDVENIKKEIIRNAKNEKSV